MNPRFKRVAEGGEQEACGVSPHRLPLPRSRPGIGWLQRPRGLQPPECRGQGRPTHVVDGRYHGNGRSRADRTTRPPCVNYSLLHLRSGHSRVELHSLCARFLWVPKFQLTTAPGTLFEEGMVGLVPSCLPREAQEPPRHDLCSCGCGPGCVELWNNFNPCLTVTTRGTFARMTAGTFTH